MPRFIPVRVQTPESVLEFNIKANSSGLVLFEQVCKTVGVRETWYFGLRHDEENKRKWLKLNKKVASSSKVKDSLHFTFMVKFYPEEVTAELIEENTQRFIYHHVKSMVISGEIYCPAETAVLLAGYQARIRHGPYEEVVQQSGFITVPNYIPQRLRDQYTLTDGEWEEKIVKWYSGHNDLSKEDATMEYLKIAQDLEMYGVTYFPIQNTKHTSLLLGVEACGLNVYTADNQITPKVSFPWNEIKQVNFNHTKFTVKPADSSAKDLVFLCDNTATCKEVLSLCTGNHELFVRRHAPDSIEVQQMKAQAKATKDARDAEREKLIAERRKREWLEQRVNEYKMEVKQKEAAFEDNQDKLNQLQQQVLELQSQLENEKKLRRDLENMQQQLEEVNNRLEHESMASADERNRLLTERDEVIYRINEQNELIENKEREKNVVESQLIILQADRDRELKLMNGGNVAAQDLQSMEAPPEDDRHAMASTDVNHMKQLKVLHVEFAASRNWDKLEKIDIDFEETKKRDVDKYTTLKIIRQGNTKSRVEQFESM